MANVVVYAIAKNEAKHVQRWYDSIKEADAIYVLDTGSEDNTVELLEDLGVTVFSASFDPFRFDYARNFILNQIKEQPEIDYAMFLDLDEVVDPGWYEKIQEAATAHPSATGINTRMIFSTTATGEPEITYNRLMIHKPQTYNWMYPVHELLMAEGYEEEIFTDIVVRHLPDESKSRGSYLSLLELGVWSHPNDPRPAYYLGREYAALGQCSDSISILKKHIELEPNRWLRSESYSLQAECYEALGDTKEARDCHALACAEAPDIRESWAKAAAFYFRVERYHSSLGCIENMFDVSEAPTHTLIRNDSYYKEWPFHMAAVCFDSLGDNAKARSNITRAFNLCPQDPTILRDLIAICRLKVERTS